ncbi:MAG: ribonuclease HII [bacterium]|nr:ribonuclease HII [bacterium]
MDPFPNWSVENQFWSENEIIAGIDEAGRGPLAGPVVVAAVVFSKEVKIDGLKDSKKLSQKKREKLFYEIISLADSYSICAVGSDLIDRCNILNATYTAMQRALSSLHLQPSLVLVDGLKARIPYKQIPIVKGDVKVASIAAASILAKVQRDKMMKFYSRMYPNYEFEKHKGYPTKVHKKLLSQFAPSPIHRKTFRLIDESEFEFKA